MRGWMHPVRWLPLVAAAVLAWPGAPRAAAAVAPALPAAHAGPAATPGVAALPRALQRRASPCRQARSACGSTGLPR